MDFSAQDSSGMFSSIPDIQGYQADFVNAENIWNGHAKSADWGGAVGAGIGAYFGSPQTGATIGRAVLPILNKGFNHIFGK